MFVRDFIEVPQPFETVAPQLVRDAAWLDPIAHDALRGAITSLGALRPDQSVSLGLAPVAVRCVRGPVRLRADTLVMPLRWDTNLPAELVPHVDGELEVVPLGVDRSQIALNANTAGSSSDHDGVTRRLVEITMRAFLRQLAVTLERIP